MVKNRLCGDIARPVFTVPIFRPGRIGRTIQNTCGIRVWLMVCFIIDSSIKPKLRLKSNGVMRSVV